MGHFCSKQSKMHSQIAIFFPSLQYIFSIVYASHFRLFLSGIHSLQIVYSI